MRYERSIQNSLLIKLKLLFIFIILIVIYKDILKFIIKNVSS
jgi:hypothetical protein